MQYELATYSDSDVSVELLCSDQLASDPALVLDGRLLPVIVSSEELDVDRPDIWHDVCLWGDPSVVVKQINILILIH